ncbi:MAG: 4-hydroxy-2-oxovalerate aldolase, partial [Gammaproteobacteria bacterium]
MQNMKLLDVTLRDGGYKTNFCFSPEIISNVLTSLDQSGVEYIEIGYRNGSFKPIPNIGPAGMCAEEYINYCKSWIQFAKLTVILHPKNISWSDMEEMQKCGVDSVRICFPTQHPLLGLKTIEMAQQCNFEVFVNITRVSQYTQEQLLEWIHQIEPYNVKAIYLADSNGNLTPYEVSKLFTYLNEKSTASFGFHAHDNLFLAQANAVAALNHGVEYIDASLYG